MRGGDPGGKDQTDDMDIVGGTKRHLRRAERARRLNQLAVRSASSVIARRIFDRPALRDSEVGNRTKQSR